jgi:Tfp pilus assembly protein PilF
MPDSANTADTLGWVLYKRGVPSAAIGYLKEAVASARPDDPTRALIRYHLAKAYEASGDVAQARKTVDEALAEHDAYAQTRHTESGNAPSQPTWYAEAKQMKERL